MKISILSIFSKFFESLTLQLLRSISKKKVAIELDVRFNKIIDSKPGGPG